MKGTTQNLKLVITFRLTLLMALMYKTALLAQGFTISGRAYDEADKKFGPVRVVLYDQDKKKVFEDKTAGNGKFKIKDIVNGKYTMNIYGEGGRGITENITINGSDITDLKPSLLPNEDQVQLTIKATTDGASINWQTVPDAKEFIVYRDNKEISTVTETSFLDPVEPSKTFAYGVTVLKNDGTKGTRSITEYGKTSIPFPSDIKGSAKKNNSNLNWFPVEEASGYKIYRDGEEINKTSDNSFTDFKLKYETEYSYQVVSLDHHSEEGDKSSNVFITTHPEIGKPKGLKAESGENQVVLNWRETEHSVIYYVYQNGALIDSTTSLTISVTTEAGTENCFSISGVDQYKTIGPRSDAACDKSVFSPPDSITVTNDKRNNNLIEWSIVEGAASYNLYADGKLQTNTTKLEINLKSLKWDTDYSYHLTSLTDEGVEGPESEKYTIRTPKIFIIEGLLLDETGDGNNVDQAKVFLYDSLGSQLLEEFVVSKNGKFRFEKEIISNHYKIMVYGNGSGNGGERVHIKSSDITNLKINLSTDGLRPVVNVERGVGQLTVNWSDIPQAKSYNIYKNDRFIQNIVTDTFYVDIVAPGIPTTYMVRSIDLYDLEGPTSNSITEKASYPPPELTISVIAGGYATEGSGRLVNIEWQPIPGVEKYALYRDGELLSKLSETIYEEKDLSWNTNYVYDINSIDGDDIEGVNYTDSILTHPEVIAPIFKLTGEVNSIALSWEAIPGMEGKYKIFRNGGNIADLDALGFIDNVNPGIEYCYTLAAEDTHKTVGPKADIQCAKGFFAPPSNFIVKVLRNTTSMTWEPVTGASGYRLYRDNELIFDTPDLTVFSDLDLEFDNKYTYGICSYDQDGDDGPRIEKELLTHEEVLTTSINVFSDLEKIMLNWDKSKLRAEHKYRIYRDDELLTEVVDTIYNDIIPAGKFYCYKVTVVDVYGTESLFSNAECEKVLVNFPRMLDVTGDVRRVLFGWKHMIGATSYNIYMVDKETDSLSFLIKTKGNYFEHKNLEFDTEYCYQVESEDADEDVGPKSPTMCGYVLPPPHLTLIEKKFMENSGNEMLDGRESGWAIFKIVNDGRSPARELKPWLNPQKDAITPSLKIDSIQTIQILGVGDTLQIEIPIYAKLKIESGERKFNFQVQEFSGMHLDPEPFSFKTLKVVPPNLVVTDFGIDNEWGQNYVPKNETVTMTIRVQNLSEGLTDTASIKFARDSSFIIEDTDELHEFSSINNGEYVDLSFEVLSRADNFSVNIDLYDYFETRKTETIYIETMKKYKGKKDLIVYETPYPSQVVVSEKSIRDELLLEIPRVSLERETIGIVLGNPTFWDSSIVSKPSVITNVKKVRSYFYDLFGMENHDIIPSQYWFFNDGITRNDFKAVFDPNLGYVRKKITASLEYSGNDSLDLILYLNGEGTTINGDKVLITYDATLSKVNSFYYIKDLYENLSEIQNIPEVGNITLFMDIDFNNKSFPQNIIKPGDLVDDKKKKKKKRKKKKKGEPEIPTIVLPKEILPPKNITAFFAANTTQIAYDHPENSNSIYTYFLLKGLRGEADNGDKDLTIAELHDYVKKNVEEKTKTLFGELPQVPILFTSNPDRVLYRLP